MCAAHAPLTTHSGGVHEMIQRIALLIGGLGAAMVLALALGAGNLITFGAQAPTATAALDAQVVADAGAGNAQPDVTAAPANGSTGKQNGAGKDTNTSPPTVT